MNGKTNWIKEYGPIAIGLLAFLVTAGTMIYGAGILRGNVEQNTKDNVEQDKELEVLKATASQNAATAAQNAATAKQNAKAAAELNQAVDSLGGLIHRMQIEQATNTAEQRALINQNKEVLKEIKEDLRGR